MMKQSKEQGSALIFALVLVFVLTVMGASMMFLSRSETWSSFNYRLMTQARYGAEAGLNTGANYLMNVYVPPGQNVADPLTAYNWVSTSPVTAGGANVILSSNPNVPAQYPAGAVKDAFSANAMGHVASANTTVNYTVTAQLIAMRQVSVFDSPNPQTIQSWLLTSDATINGVRNSAVEVTAVLEKPVFPTFNYAAFATSSGCGAINFSGGGTIDSYDSQAISLPVGGVPVTQAYAGNLGSNGNVNTASNTAINGTFSSPDTGVGNCAAGNVDALSGNPAALTGCESGTVNCQGGSSALIKLPQPLVYPPPTLPATIPAPLGTVPNGTASISPGNYDQVNLSSGDLLTLLPTGSGANCSAGTYYVNSIKESGQGAVTIGPCPGTNPPVYMPIFINVINGSGDATPISLTGQGLANPSYDSTKLQIVYAGTAEIKIAGNGDYAGVVYAPSASITLGGNGTVYGAIIGQQIDSKGNPVQVHYDRALQNGGMTLGNWMLHSFSWSKF